MSDAAAASSSAAEKPLVATLLHEGVYRIVMQRPERMNALSREMMTALSEELTKAQQNKDVRVILLGAEGKVFCAGHDLKELTAARAEADRGRGTYEHIMRQCSALMQQIVRHPKPVIAVVTGVATAAGCQLVASCDLAVAAEGTRFGVNGVNIGLFCSTPMVALSRNIGRKKAFELLTTGEMIGAGRAEALGLVNRVVADDALEAETAALAEKIAGKLGRALAIGKEAFHAQLDMGMADAYTYAGRVMAENMLYSETEESISAFLEKREPRWEQ